MGGKGGSSQPQFKPPQQQQQAQPQQRPQQRQAAAAPRQQAQARPAPSQTIIYREPVIISSGSRGLAPSPTEKKRTATAPKTNFTGADGKKKLVGGSTGGSILTNPTPGDELDYLGY